MIFKKLIFAAVLLGVATSFPESAKSIPSFNYDDLINDLNQISGEQTVFQDLVETSRTLGAFIIKNLPKNDEYLNALKNLQAETPSCFEAEKERVVAARVSPSVVRSTSGVSSEDESNSHPECITSSADIIAESLDSVGALVHQVSHFHMGNQWHVC